MPRTAAQYQAIRAATRQLILDSALTLFARQGYARTSMRQIASRAGVATGLAYHYFEGKERLLQAVFDHCLARLSATLVASHRGSTATRRLTGLLGGMFALLEAEGAYWELFYLLRAQPGIRSLRGDAFDLWTRRLEQIFAIELRAAGRAAPETEALLLYSLVEGTIQQYLWDPERYPLGTVVAGIMDWLEASPGSRQARPASDVRRSSHDR